MRWGSTRCAGRASRKLSSGTRLWPPASTLASSPSSASSASASSRVVGAWYSNGGGFIDVPFPRGERALPQPEYAFWGSRQGIDFDAERVGERIGDDSRRGERAALTDAFEPTRDVRRGGLKMHD